MSNQFAFNEFNQLVHVKEVARGSACQCRCVVCNEPLVARQGEVRQHHFSHASNSEPCESNHESLLHRYAKQLIVEAWGLVAPVTPPVAEYFGWNVEADKAILQALGPVVEEYAICNVRPDILLVTTDGLQVAVEIAYSSFCDKLKAAELAQLKLPTLEIDLSAFTPEEFDPVLVKEMVIGAVDGKKWIWPVELSIELVDSNQPIQQAPKQYLPEEKISFSGRWVSIRQFSSGDIAVKCVKFDPDLVSLIKSVCKPHGARYNMQYKTWNVPRWAANIVRRDLTQKARTMQITMGPKSS